VQHWLENTSLHKRIATMFTSVCVMLVLCCLSTSLVAEERTSKLQVPEEAAQNEALTLVRATYRKEYENSTISSDKIELAKKLLKGGVATKDDHVGQFVLKVSDE
jgi:hypothetical protein